MGIGIEPGSRSRVLARKADEWAAALLADDAGTARERLMQRLSEFSEQHCNPPKDSSYITDLAYGALKKAGKSMGRECDLAASVLERLSKHFHVHEQVPGTHALTGRRLIIDAIVVPKDDIEWKTKSPRLGVEFKNFRTFSPAFDTRDYTRWWAQCNDYLNTKFDDHGYVFVFAFNAFTNYSAAMRNGAVVSQVERILGQLGIGELVEKSDGWPPQKSLAFSLQSHCIWSEVRGVRDGKRWSMERKFGSR